MAKRKTDENVLHLADWQAVDESLREMGLIDIQLAKIEAAMNQKMTDIKTESAALGAPLLDRRAALAASVKSFCDARPDEFADSRSRRLNFGTVAYRIVHSVKYNTAVENVIRAIKAFGFADCLNVKESVDKEKLLTSLTDAELSKIGAKKSTENKFRVEIDEAKIRSLS